MSKPCQRCFQKDTPVFVQEETMKMIAKVSLDSFCVCE